MLRGHLNEAGNRAGLGQEIIPPVVPEHCGSQSQALAGLQGGARRVHDDDASGIGAGSQEPASLDAVAADIAFSQYPPQMRPGAAHAQGADIGHMPAAPEVGVAALGHAGGRIGIVVIERRAKANAPDGQLDRTRVLKAVDLVKPLAAGSTADGNRQNPDPVAGGQTVDRQGRFPSRRGRISRHGEVSQPPAVGARKPGVVRLRANPVHAVGVGGMRQTRQSPGALVEGELPMLCCVHVSCTSQRIPHPAAEPPVAPQSPHPSGTGRSTRRASRLSTA